MGGVGKFFSNTEKDYNEILKVIRKDVKNIDISKLNGLVLEYKNVLQQYQPYTDSTQDRIEKLCQGLKTRIEKI